MRQWKICKGDCLQVLPTMAPCSVDSVVTDPPYGINFMGKDWDHGIPGKHFWREVLRVAKPGAWLLAFGGTRTFHRLACAIEDAGWEIRDCVMWVYGSGFPKSLDVSKAIDKANGEKRKRIPRVRVDGASTGHSGGDFNHSVDLAFTLGEPVGDLAKQWDGWGTALKPSWEPIIVARKPLEGTVAENVQKWGTGGINIDGGRVDSKGGVSGWSKTGSKKSKNISMNGDNYAREPKPDNPKGRWPANLIHDGSEEVLQRFPHLHNAGTAREAVSGGEFNGKPGWGNIGIGTKGFRIGDSGSASRFFYCAKASQEDRNEGCEEVTGQRTDFQRRTSGLSQGKNPQTGERSGKQMEPRLNFHPTVKPTSLMRYLCRLVTPPKGLVLDSFMGSGSTGKAAILEGFQFVGIEMEREYRNIARARLTWAENKKSKEISLWQHAQ